MIGVQLLRPSELFFNRVEDILGAADRTRIGRWWDDHSKQRPTLFNGQMIACSACRIDPSGSLSVDWYVTTYAHYLTRMTPLTDIEPARALYCSVALFTTSGRIAVGRMAKTTAAPDQLQLPGGNVELPDGSNLNILACAKNACRELFEEVGIALETEQLRLWRIKIGGQFGDVGIIFVNGAAIEESVLAEAFSQHRARLEAQNLVSEFAEIIFMQDPQLAEANSSRTVDYLPEVLKELSKHVDDRDG